ncbi:putative lipid II flippase FtsW [bacterium]|nr:putative lipid II flippase FtsW [bacterium]
MAKAASIFLCLAVAALICIGLVMLTSASAKWDVNDEQYYYLSRQARWLVIGLVVMVGVALIDYRLLRKFVIPLGIISVLALIGCFLPGIGDAAKGESRWIYLPLLGRFQPSEPAKLVVMIALAAWFARHQSETKTFWKGFVVPCFILGVPLLLILAETDMGTAVGLGAAGLLVLFVSGTRLLYLVPSVVSAVAGLCFMVSQDPIRMKRIMAFMDPEKYRDGVGWQQAMALEAFGNGGPSGVGLGNGIVKQMNFPEHHTDFIFPVIGEELGLAFTLGIVFCFVIIFLVGVGISLHANDLFGRILGLGASSIIVIPAMMNIGVTTSSIPNTGLPLPFVSYGGSNLVFTLAMVGVLLSILRNAIIVNSKEIPKVKAKRVELRL